MGGLQYLDMAALSHAQNVASSLLMTGRAMKKVFYYIRDPEGKIIAEVEGIEMKFADLPGKYALRSVNGCKSKWQVDETETGTWPAKARP